VVLLLSWSLLASGCSVAFTDAPPPRELRRADFDCTSGYGMPALDTALSVLGFGLLAIGGIGSSGGLSSTRNLLILGASGAFAVSAVDGYQTVYTCREALDESRPALEVPRHRRAPPPPPVSPPPPPAPPAPSP
jgi:hypothetical protein